MVFRELSLIQHARTHAAELEVKSYADQIQ